MPINITDAEAIDPVNHSEYTLDLAKMRQQPKGVEEFDGIRERRSAQDGTVSCMFLVPWSVRRAFREWALGYSYSEISPGINAARIAQYAAYTFAISGDNESAVQYRNVVLLHRVIPAQDPEEPSLFCSDCELIEGRGAVVRDPTNFVLDDEGKIETDARGPYREGGIEAGVDGFLTADAIAYVDNGLAGGISLTERVNNSLVPTPPSGEYRDGRAIYRLTYRPRNYSVINDNNVPEGNELARYVIREEEFGLEAIPLQRLANNAIANLKFVDAAPVPANLRNQMIPEAGAKQLPTAVLNYTWVDVPDRPFASYTRTLGKVNIADFDGFNGAPKFPAGTLLCQPWRTRRTLSVTGKVTWQIQYRFSVRPQGWNNFLAYDGNFYKATFGGAANGPTVYQQIDFAGLFCVPPPVKYLR